MFTVDGTQWELPCDINRVSEMTASDISGMLLNKRYFADIIGTFLRYSVTIVVPFGYEAEYAALYEILTDPVGSHEFTMPYNMGTIDIVGRVSQISDVYRRMPDGSIHWKGIKFDVISNAPHKTHTLGEAIERGITPLPNIASPAQGAIYVYTGTQWSPASFQNADGTAY